MNVTIGDIMSTPVMTVTKHQTVEHVAALMRNERVSALPVVGPDDEPLGIVTTADLLGNHPKASPVSAVMTKPAITIPADEGPHVAARIMRNHHLHHVVVVGHHEVVGILSTFDLLKLVEDHRYVAKGAPTPARRAPNRQ